MTVFRLLRSAAETLLPGADNLCRATRELLSRRRSGSVIRLETTADKGLLHTLLLGYAKTDPSNGTAACPRLDLRFCRQLADRLPQPFAGRHGAVHRQRISGEKRTRSLPYGGVIAWPFIRLKILTASFVFCSRLQPIPRFG